MHRHDHHRNPLFCIVPPYVLDQIVLNGSPRQRAAALKTSSVDNTIRAFRLANQNVQAVPVRRSPRQIMDEPTKLRTVYTANNSRNLPGTVVRVEGQLATGDAAADEAYDGLGATFDFFSEVFGRNSIDDVGMALDATVHFGDDYNNAFWNSAQMVFGDGDGEIFNRFTICLDVIAHELAHGVTEDESQLQYFNQSGALNESLSDVFGAMVRQFHLGESAIDAGWLIGDGLFTSNVHGVALRSMKDPGSAYDDPVLGKDPQPKHMDHFVQTFDDNGGVHINSGIPNHAFYQIAIALGGNAWDKAGHIWYDTLRSPELAPNTGFRRFAQITHEAARLRYGADSAEQLAVQNGWAQVGIAVDRSNNR